MNQIIVNIMIVYSIASIVYLIYIKILNKNTLEAVLVNNTELLEKYKQIKKERAMVFIIGIIIGLILLIFIDNNDMKEINETSYIIVSDVSDIRVL
jgi:di/tricarboxylate transporter